MPEDWREGKSLVQCNRYILEQEVACDVHFIVGQAENRRRIGAHKTILMTRSNVFFAMFEGTMAELGSVITIPDIDPFSFKLMLLYIYCDDDRVDISDSFPVLYAAQKYNLKGLAEKCTQRIKTAISTSKVCWVLMHACTWMQEEIKRLCLQYIILHSFAVFGTKGFLDLNLPTLIEVVKHDRVNMEEKDIFEAVVKWGRHRCRTALLPTTSIRDFIGNVLPYIRFARMELSYFSEKVSHMGILTESELVEHFKFLTTSKADHPDPPRDRRVVFQRFSGVKSGKGYHRGNADAISFMLSKNVMMHAVLVYGSCQYNASYRIKIKILKDGEHPVYEKNIELETDGFTKTYPIEIEPPLQMERETCFTVLMVMEGPVSYYGDGGVIQKQHEGMTITFIPNEKGLNGTNIKYGQFNGFVFKKI